MSVFSAVRDLGRLREISAVLVRHGFGEIVTRVGIGKREELKETDEAGEKERSRVSRGERIRLVAQELGPSFVKLGQIASTRTDVIPPDIINELKKLQDEVPPVAFEEIKRQVEGSLGAPIADVFVRFDEKPLASASIGQVHRGALHVDGEDVEVVVKVQRPGVAATVARDSDFLHMMAAALERAVPETKIYSPVGLVNQFDRSITSELNFLVEADHCERFARNFEGHDEVRFPKIYRQASSRHVLVQEFFPGKKITETKADGKKIAKASVQVIIKMIFEDGFFHADPHPGNVIILGTDDEPVIGLIDTGMVGRLSPELRDRTIDLMIAAARKDTYGVADALYAIARPTKKVDMREYRAHVAALADKYLGRPLGEMDLSAMIRDIVQGAMKYGLEIPTDFLLVGKALMTVEGVGKQLDPTLDVFAEGQPYFSISCASVIRRSASAWSFGVASSKCRARAGTCRSRCARCSTICAPVASRFKCRTRSSRTTSIARAAACSRASSRRRSSCRAHTCFAARLTKIADGRSSGSARSCARFTGRATWSRSRRRDPTSYLITRR